MGRPTKLKSEKKDIIIRLRLSEAELKKLDKLCKKYNTNRSNILRKNINDLEDTSTKNILINNSFLQTIQALSETLNEINSNYKRIGTNINQIARSMNSNYINHFEMKQLNDSIIININAINAKLKEVLKCL